MKGTKTADFIADLKKAAKRERSQEREEIKQQISNKRFLKDKDAMICLIQHNHLMPSK